MTTSGSQQSTVEGSAHWTADCSAAVSAGRGPTLTVHTRSVAPEFGTRDYLTGVRERVRELEANGRVTAVQSDVWGTHVAAEETDRVDDETAAAVDDYQAWARRENVGLPFEERHCNSMLIEDTYTVLVPPHVLVAVRDGDGEVLGVAPSVDETGPTSVMDLLTILENKERADEPRASASA